MLSSINAEQELYVIESNYGKQKGYTQLGFDYAYSRAKAVAEWANLAFRPSERNKGNMAGYDEYVATMKEGAEYANRTGKRCNVELTEQLKGLEGKRVEVIDKYGDKRRFYVGKSTGWMPCHLEIAQRNSSGGMAVYGASFKSVTVVGVR